MQPGEYNFTDHVRGDTLTPVTITITQSVDGATATAVDLTNCVIVCMFKRTKSAPALLTLSTANGYIVISDPTAGEIQIGAASPVSLEIAAATYLYDMQFTFPTGEVRTYLAGTLTILEDITR